MANTDITSERAVVGIMLIDPECTETGLLECVAEDFTDADCRRIFAAMQFLRGAGSPIDMVTVSGMFDADYAMKVVEIASSRGWMHNFGAYVLAVKHAAKMRRFMNGMGKIMQGAAEGNQSCFAETQKLLDEISNEGSTEMTLIGDIVSDALTELGDTKRGISTGYPLLDKYIKGLVPGNLVVIAGRPSMGKSSIAENIAANVAKQGKVVAMFSLEMKASEIAQRIALGLSRMGVKDILSDTDKADKFMRSAKIIRPMKFYTYDKGALSAEKTQTMCRKVLNKEGHLDVVVIDYIGLMKTNQRKNSSRQQEIGEITHAMKQMAQELNCTVVIVSQLNRGPELRPNHKPVMADLRESGDIEQDADIILFPFRPYVYDKEQDEKTAQLILAKNRNGATGEIDLYWRGEWFLFENPATEFQEAQCPDCWEEKANGGNGR